MWMVLQHPERLPPTVLSVLATQALTVVTALRAHVGPSWLPGASLDAWSNGDAARPTAVIDGRSVQQHASRMFGLFATTVPMEDRGGGPGVTASVLVSGQDYFPAKLCEALRSSATSPSGFFLYTTHPAPACRSFPFAICCLWLGTFVGCDFCAFLRYCALHVLLWLYRPRSARHALCPLMPAPSWLPAS